MAAVRADGFIREDGQLVGTVLDRLPATVAVLAQGEPRTGLEPALCTDAILACCPVLLAPGAAGSQCFGGNAAGGGVSDECAEAVEALGQEQCDMTVAAVLPQQRLRMPQHEVRKLGPRQGGVAGKERAALGSAGRMLGGPAG